MKTHDISFLFGTTVGFTSLLEFAWIRVGVDKLYRGE